MKELFYRHKLLSMRVHSVCFGMLLKRWQYDNGRHSVERNYIRISIYFRSEYATHRIEIKYSNNRDAIIWRRRGWTNKKEKKALTGINMNINIFTIFNSVSITIFTKWWLCDRCSRVHRIHFALEFWICSFTKIY